MIEFRDIRMVFDGADGTDREALRSLSLSVPRGEWCNLLGPNGSGKSTLLRLLAGDLKPTAGDVLIEGRSVIKLPAVRRAKMLFVAEQDTKANLVSSMTIEENLLLHACRSTYPRPLPIRSKSRHAHIVAAVERLGMGIEDMLKVQVRSLSGGERQAVVLAMALLASAPILLLDEFLAAMDPKRGPALLRVAKELAREEDLTVLSVTHNLEHIVNLGEDDERVVMLREGRIVQDVRLGDVPSVKWLVENYEGAITARWQAPNPRVP